MSAALLRWASKHGRHDLPWQRPASGYRVWVSEIMLQQTQVATVIPYFERFIQRFPSIETLARAKLDEVLAEWSGLGYYARAINLHKAARRVATEFSGRLPDNYQQLVGLPGIGRSTAGAILSLAFGQRRALLDANAKRVLARYHGISAALDRSSVLTELWQLAEAALPRRRVGAYNQALMDLGAGVCTLRRPSCGDCPLHDCLAYHSGNPEAYPRKKSKPPRPVRKTFFLLLENNHGHWLLEKRAAQGRWGGLWSFPEFDRADDAKLWATEVWGFEIQQQRLLDAFRHSFSHFHFHITPLHLHGKITRPRVMDAEHWVWYNGGPKPGGIPKPASRLLSTYYPSRTGIV